MEIWNGLRSLTPQFRKKDVISDLFNNQSVDGQEQTDTKLRLSRTSRVLNQKLNAASDQFLKQNPAIKSALDKVPLGDDGAPVSSSRQLGAYARWLDIRQPDAGPVQDPSTDEQAYLEAHKAGKDAEIQGIFQSYDTERQQSVQARSSLSPNYYYKTYPEVYAFN